MLLVSRVDLVAPLPRPLIQILPTAEAASCQEVVLYEMKRSLHPSRTIRIPDRVGHELKAEPLSKSGHLRYWHHVAPAAPEHNHVRVVDHHPGWAAGKVAHRIGEKHLAIEALKARIALEKQHPRIAKHRRSRLHLALLSGQFHLVRRRVVLKFLCWRKLILSRRCWRLISNSMPPAK